VTNPLCSAEIHEPAWTGSEYLCLACGEFQGSDFGSWERARHPSKHISAARTANAHIRVLIADSGSTWRFDLTDGEAVYLRTRLADALIAAATEGDLL